MKTFAIAAVASLAAFGAAPAAFGATPASVEPVRVEISYGDLDIATPVGADELAERIASSVRDACGVRTSRTLKAAASADACRDEMLASAVAELDSKGATLAAGRLSARG